MCAISALGARPHHVRDRLSVRAARRGERHSSTDVKLSRGRARRHLLQQCAAAAPAAGFGGPRAERELAGICTLSSLHWRGHYGARFVKENAGMIVSIYRSWCLRSAAARRAHRAGRLCRRPGAGGTAGVLSQHGECGGAGRRSHRGVDDLRLSPQQRPRRGRGRPRADAARAANRRAAWRRSDKLDRSAGRDFNKSLAGAGFNSKKAVENVSAGYHTLAEAFSGWRDSPPHRANMLNAGANRMGIAAVYSPQSKYKVFWALIMATKDSGV